MVGLTLGLESKENEGFLDSLSVEPEGGSPFG